MESTAPPETPDRSPESAAGRTVEAVWRIESGRLIAGLARVTGDVGLAEEVAQDALVAALERWPVDGVPPNPAGWLTTTAKNRLIDRHRRDAALRRRTPALERDAEHAQDALAAELDHALDDRVGDDLLRLMFAACHPSLSTEARVALTLRCLGGLTTEEIARAFLVPEATAAQRIVRAKRNLSQAPGALRMPDRHELPERLGSVLEVIYLIFNEGYAATSGDELLRRSLTDEAIRLGRILAALAPGEADVHGLLALMEMQACRAAARTNRSGETVLLPDQDRALWDRLLLRRGLDSLARAYTAGTPIGVYTVQAAIAACHVRGSSSLDTDWAAIVSLYDVLAHLWPSPCSSTARSPSP
jgi:RNA polymerase sigma factor (sigma-70 family)